MSRWKAGSSPRSRSGPRTVQVAPSTPRKKRRVFVGVAAVNAGAIGVSSRHAPRERRRIRAVRSRAVLFQIDRIFSSFTPTGSLPLRLYQTGWRSP
jgi:hypothetical protein